MTYAYLEDKPEARTAASAATQSSSGSRLIPKMLGGSGNGKVSSMFGMRLASIRAATQPASTVPSEIEVSPAASADGEGEYIIFDVGESIFISDLNTIKKVHKSRCVHCIAVYNVLRFVQAGMH